MRSAYIFAEKIIDDLLEDINADLIAEELPIGSIYEEMCRSYIRMVDDCRDRSKKNKYDDDWDDKLFDKWDLEYKDFIGTVISEVKKRLKDEN